MKYKTILKSFLLLMLMYVFSSSVSASEIIANLSSSGGVSSQSINNSFSSDGTALQPPSRNLAFYVSSNELISDNHVDNGFMDGSTQTASALDAFDSFSMGAWFWIILLILLFSIGIVYIYKGTLSKSKEKVF